MNHGESGKCSTKLVLIKTNKKALTSYKVIFHYCGTYGHIRQLCFKMLHDLKWRCIVLVEVPTSHGILPMKKQKVVWMKNYAKCFLIANQLLKLIIDDVWYFNNGYHNI